MFIYFFLKKIEDQEDSRQSKCLEGLEILLCLVVETLPPCLEPLKVLRKENFKENND